MLEQGKFKNFLRKSISSLLIANAVLVGGIDVLLQGVHDAVSSRILNRAQLENLVDIERKKAGISDESAINVYIGHESCAKKISENSYEITLKDDFNDVATLRHELYHIARGHCDRLYSSGNSRLERLGNGMKYLWIEEPQAVIYSATGVKL